MSSFGSLFGSSDSKNVDKTVEDLFKNSTGPVDKSKLVRERHVIDIPNFKRGSKKQATVEDEESSEDSEDEEEIDVSPAKTSKKGKKDVNDDLESKYFNKLLAEEKKEQDAKAAERKEDNKEVNEDNKEDGSDSDSDSDSESESENENEVKASSSSKTKAATTTDLKESELEKAERTIFVGNVLNTVITNKQIYKRFKTLFGKYGKIKSIRFRSISFEDAVPRKVAFAKKSLHNSRDTINAYVVYEAKEASLEAAKKLNGTIFEHNHLRTDHVAHPSPKDNKRTIFVGNLDFEEKEETLWKYFQEHSSNDVELVRIIRDSKTNLGKGFALVQFKDTLSVNKALLLHDKPISKDKKRKLRITRASSKAKPSILSPNHIDNTKKAFASNKSKKLNDQQKTKLGRATTILGKADRATAGQTKYALEGQRATKGGLIAGIKGLKGARVKKPRIRDRSTKFKEARSEAIKDAVQKERDTPRERDTRGPPRDSRGPPRDSRGPPRDSRGPPRDSRGPPRDSRGPPRDSRGPPRDSRGPPRDSRGPPRGGRGGSRGGRGGRGGSRGGRGGRN